MPSEQPPKLFSGPVLAVCPGCAGFVASRFCARCGERLSAPGNALFTLRLEKNTRRNALLAKRLMGYPGNWDPKSDPLSVPVERIEEIAALAGRLGSSLKGPNVTLVGNSGQRILPADPVFSCVMGVMDSGIRGCMTQRARPPLCHREAALLPLLEKMQTFSLADLLEDAGRGDLVGELCLGVLSGLSRTPGRGRCPLLGRALRLSAADAEGLPFWLAELEEGADTGAMVEKFFPTVGKRARRRTIAVSLSESATAQIPDLCGKACLAARCGDSLLLAGGVAGAEPGGRRPPSASQPALWAVSGSTAQPLAGSSEVAFVHPAGECFAAGHVREGNVATIDLVTPAVGERAAVSVGLHLSDFDVFGQAAGALLVVRNRFHVASCDLESGEVGSEGWQAGEMQAAWWRLLLGLPGYAWTWNDRGAMALLGPSRGWLLTSAHGGGRHRFEQASGVDFVGVQGVCRSGDTVIAVLSSFGHRLTGISIRVSGDSEAVPVERHWDLLLPHPAYGVTSDEQGLLYLVGPRRAFVVDSRSGEVLAGLPAHGIALVEGGGFWSGGEDSEGKLFRIGKSGPPMTGPDLAVAAVQLARACRHEEEIRPILDRAGRLPHRPTWGI